VNTLKDYITLKLLNNHIFETADNLESLRKRKKEKRKDTKAKTLMKLDIICI